MSEQTNPDTPLRLTQYAHGAGCGCKIAPAVLQQMLAGMGAPAAHPQLLVGYGGADDAAVYDLGNGTALVSTADFFMPIVDVPFDFGRIAAANALSDVYAMGGSPLMALALLGWPVEKLPAEAASRVLAGARAVCDEAGIPLAGGHSIDSPEPFFGLAATGLVPRENLRRNDGGRAGDLLLLTKPLGTGILSTALKRGLLEPGHEPLLMDNLAKLNKAGAALGALPAVHAMTDVTGFGLLGHLLEMANGAGLGAEIRYSALPVLPVQAYLANRVVPDATYRNWNSYSAQVGFDKGVNVMEAFSLLPDPQTNGGLLVAVDPAGLPEVQACLQAEGIVPIEPIGRLTERGEKAIWVTG